MVFAANQIASEERHYSQHVENIIVTATAFRTRV